MKHVTRELFRVDPYRCEFEATVIRSDGHRMVLDQTCFCPATSYGFTPDRGWFGSQEVTTVRQPGGQDIWHEVVGGTKFAVGTPIRATVDWPHRYATMRLHSAFHILELGLRETSDVQAISTSGVGDGFIDMTINFRSASAELGPAEAWVARVIDQDLPTSSSQEPWPPDQWVWHLDGYGHRACDALHVRSTGEIGLVDISILSSVDRQVRLRLCVGADGGALTVDGDGS